jgi:hypothetical protein
MTLEELLKAAKEAKAKADNAPTDKALAKAAAEAQAAYDTALAASEEESEEEETEEKAGGKPDEFDDSKTDDATKKYLAKLRKEAAGHRTKGKDLASQLATEKARTKAILKAAGIESEEEKPEEKIKSLDSQNQSLAFDKAILELALEHGIPKDGVKYLKFLVNEAAAELPEGEELEEEKLAEIVAESKKGRGTGSGANTSVGTSKGKGAPAPGGKSSGEVSLAKFCSMNTSEKSSLYEKNRDLYTSLMAEARAKKMLV